MLSSFLRSSSLIRYIHSHNPFLSRWNLPLNLICLLKHSFRLKWHRPDEDETEELAELESGDSFPPSPRVGAGDGVTMRPPSRSPRSPRALSLMESCVLRSASIHLPGFCSPGLGRKGRDPPHSFILFIEDFPHPFLVARSPLADRSLTTPIMDVSI